MSQQVDLKEFLPAYLAEVDEQLQLANARLLDIEASSRKEEPNHRAVRDLFRAIHTVKGLSAMVGVDAAVALSHRMETVLRDLDTSGLPIALTAIDTLLRGVRAIERQVRDLADGKDPSPAPAAIMDALGQLEPSARAAPPPTGTLTLDEAVLRKLAPFEVALLANGPSSGRRAVRVDFSPSPSKAARGFSVNTVRERVGSIAEIIKVVPMSVPVSEDAPGALSFALLVLTFASDDDLAAAVGVRAEDVLTLTPQGAIPAEAAPHPMQGSTDDDELEDLVKPQRRNIVRVDVLRLDDAMDHLSALIVTRSRLARAVQALTAAGVGTRELNDIMRDNARQLRDLRAAILRVRMIPITEVLERIPLILRGLRRESGKLVRLKVEGGSAELDKGVAERLFPAIVHLVRNAMDHAFELPDARRAMGKPEEGTLRIACTARSNTRLELVVTDDGRGVDRGAIERRLGHSVPDTGPGLLDALCHAGFTTKDEVTTTSGRGMGMDIVRRIVVEQLGGELGMTTVNGEGTTFTLRVPLTISIVDAFTANCHDQRFVVPVSMVEEIFEIDRSKVRFGPHRAEKDSFRPGLVERRGETVPLVDLATLLSIRTHDEPGRQAIVVRRGGEPVAFALDKVLGQQEAVVRPLIDPLVQVLGVTGATDLGDGRPSLVLDLVALAARLTQQGTRSAA